MSRKILFIIVILILSMSMIYANEYAVLISPGLTTQDNSTNNSEYWYDLYLAYEMLISKGLSKNEIFVCYGNGSSFSSTVWNYRLLKHLWLNIVDASNSKSDIEDVFDDLSSTLTTNDVLIVYWLLGDGVNSYGGSTSNDNFAAYISNQNEFISESEIISMINSVPAARRIIFWNCDHSGCLVQGNNVLSSDKNFVYTACDWDEDTYYLTTDYSHGRFSYYVTGYLNGSAPISGGSQVLDGDTNYNNDGYLTLFELRQNVSGILDDIVYGYTQVGGIDYWDYTHLTGVTPMTSSGTIDRWQVWHDTHTLTDDIDVEGTWLKISDDMTLNLGGHSVTQSNGGYIIIEGDDDLVDINPYIALKIANRSDCHGLYPNLSEVLSDASTGDEITINSNITLPNGTDLSVPAGVTIKLHSGYIDLNGNTLSFGTGASIEPNVCVKNGTIIERYYPTIGEALAYSTTGEVVEVRGEYTSTVTVSVGSGQSLKPQSGSVLKFAAGTSLNVNSGGNLTANGATFIRSGGSSWGGVKYYSGSLGSLTNSTISGSTYGIYMNSVNRTISGCTIENGTTYGIYLYNADPSISYTTIEADYGIWATNGSSPLVLNNTIGNNEEVSATGLYCYNSSPRLVNPGGANGNNSFENSFISIAVHANGTSYPILGFSTCSNDYGNNQFNYGLVDDYLVRAEANSEVEAEHCWWGSSSPNASLFYGTVDYIPYLTTIPSSFIINPESNLFDQRFMLASAVPDGNEEVSEDLTQFYNERWSLEKRVEFLRYLYFIGEAEGVADLCKDIIFENPYDVKAFAAMDLIYQISKNENIKKDIDKEMFKTYLKSFENSKSSKFLEANAMLLLGRLEKDVKRMDKVYKEHKNDYMGKYALNDKFMYFFHEEEDMELARAIINEMDEVYPDENVTYEAHLLIGDDVMDPVEFYSQYNKTETTEKLQATTDISEILPEEYSLSPAYPNPFNPSTTIEFALPVQSDVECSIFDLRGNLVKEYSYEQYAGTHSVIWNADQFSSGIYLIRFVAKAVDGTNSFVDYQKVTLLK